MSATHTDNNDSHGPSHSGIINSAIAGGPAGRQGHAAAPSTDTGMGPSLKDRIAGEGEVIMGKLQHDQLKVVDGEMRRDEGKTAAVLNTKGGEY